MCKVRRLGLYGLLYRGIQFLDGATNKSVLNIESSLYDYAQHGLKNAKMYKECMSSLALLPHRDFADFERQFPPIYYIQRAKNFTMY